MCKKVELEDYYEVNEIIRSIFGVKKNRIEASNVGRGFNQYLIKPDEAGLR